MVNNSTNINKTNDNLLSQIIGCKKKQTKTTGIGVGNQNPDLRQAQKCGR
jgi:hypothetical protein